MSLTIHLNGHETHLDQVRTVQDLIVHLGYQGKRIAVERNGDIVPRSQHASRALAEGDQVEIVHAIGGG